ncbi:hypothetical protein HMPREF1624_05866 [Sporothrix schenckii ATCC 58251]|uniref:Mob1/phocein family protein n=1 Tax=Sporothrix schenckii (strain ATCC 58251 / de Perez 2211183) TaxID=1391915 RepID=U7PT99_SPOS1|nr:hypothetical protein HMPREF1624_05866 [Sporothrix schenckii ATCC 58251]
MALPPSSPRLPSPPPAAEIQIGPKSPAASGATLAQQQMEQQMEQTILDANSKRRIHPGTRAADFAVGPPLVPLNELDSAFQLQEHLAALHYHHTANNTIPISRETAHILAQAPAGTDRTLWLYELCRFLIAQCNSLIVGFLFDTPPCSATTCPEMRASEWQFLCAVHEQPRSCCAIDYCCHTLDWAANVVTNPKIFPSRFVFADPHDKNAAVKNLINVFRRLHRIFAHAWFQHRGVFWSVEGQTGLYVFFKTVCDMYDLLPAENYKLPPEAEGLDVTPSVAVSGSGAPAEPSTNESSTAPSENVAPGLIPMSSIADKKSLAMNPASGGAAGDRSAYRSGSGPAGAGSTSSSGTGLAADLLGADSEHLHAVGRTNTRRHIRSSPSTGSAVTTVLEQDEDGANAAPGAAGRPVSILKNTHLAPALARSSSHSTTPPTVTEQEVPADESKTDGNGAGTGTDASTTSVPIIVEHHQHKSATATPPEQEPASTVEASTTDSTETEQTELSAEPANAGANPPNENEPTEPITVIVAGELAEATGGAAAAAEKPPKEESTGVPAASETATEEVTSTVEDESAKDVKPTDGTSPVATKEESTATETEPAPEDTSNATEETPEAATPEGKEATDKAQKEDEATKAEAAEAKADVETEATAEPAPIAEE